ncbi:SMI1/KNR4 family protein [Fictibacillus macauensis]|uniref:SMI1/KNR4 family protein n=1 Tax=Fictibacillus macauensis TaxID=245160 RepID=UPI000A006190
MNRSYGLPKDLIVIENCDEWIYCIHSKTNKIHTWSQGDSQGSNDYESFQAYLLDRINDMLENM